MPRELTRRLLVSLALLTPGWALAYTPAPSRAQVDEAYQAGQRLAQNADSGYALKNYLIYAVPDALKIEPQNGAVDAVAAGTPLERTRYQSFLSALGEDPITAQQARERANLPDHSVEFIVFAHGLTVEDRVFQSRFSTAQLRLGGQTLKSSSIEKSSYSTSLYPRTPGGGIPTRNTGLVIYHFDIPDKLDTSSGTLTFTDASGKKFSLPVDLTKYD